MLSSLENGILTLLRNALKGEKQTLPSDFDFEIAYNFGKKHQIIPILYYGGAHLDALTKSEIGAHFLMSTMTLASYSEDQIREINALSKAFLDEGIEHLKLKGTVLKSLYPHPEMRLMSDSDILIKEEQEDKIERIMKSLGYTFKVSSDHEWIWEKGKMTIELHRRIIASYQKDFYAYFGNGWQLAKRAGDTSEYKMSLEDEFIYLFTHLSKHYRDAGIGIKHFTDIYVFLNAHTDLDMEYIRATLKSLGLLAFFDNVLAVLDAWFDDGEVTPVVEFITAKVFDSGVYGSRLTEIKANALKERNSGKKKSKIARLWTLIFPPYKNMCYIFPVLKKAPILLPFMWVYRWLKAIFTKKDRIEKAAKDLDTEVSSQVIDEYQYELSYVGLDFYKEENK